MSLLKGKARHHQQGRRVDAAGTGEIDRSYPGRSAWVPVVLWCRRADGPHRKVRADFTGRSQQRS